MSRYHTGTEFSAGDGYVFSLPVDDSSEGACCELPIPTLALQATAHENAIEGQYILFVLRRKITSASRPAGQGQSGKLRQVPGASNLLASVGWPKNFYIFGEFELNQALQKVDIYLSWKISLLNVSIAASVPFIVAIRGILFSFK